MARHFHDLSRSKIICQHTQKEKVFNHNHEIHFIAREINDWMPAGIQTINNGKYNPHYLRRHYFKDEIVDQPYLPDRILQHVLLKQLKPTIAHVISPNCFHVHGPNGVKLATQKIRKALEKDHDQLPQYVIRADIKLFYHSVPHYKLIADINKIYADPKSKISG